MAEVPRPEAGEDMYVSVLTVRVIGTPARPAPTYQEGGSSGSSSRANEMNTDERDAKRVKFTEKPRPEQARRRCGRVGSERGRTTSRR